MWMINCSVSIAFQANPRTLLDTGKGVIKQGSRAEVCINNHSGEDANKKYQ